MLFLIVEHITILPAVETGNGNGMITAEILLTAAAITFWYTMKAIIQVLVKFGIILGRMINTWRSNAYWKKRARRDAWLDESDKMRDDESATEQTIRNP